MEGVAGKEPTVRAPDGAPGRELVARVLTEGTGPAVAKGDLLVAHYLGQTWRENRGFDSSYDRNTPAAFPIGVGGVVAGWDEGLVGRKVGSRVLLVIPPDKGYGAAGQPQAGIKGDDTLVFVVDLLARHAGGQGVVGKPVATPADLPKVSSGSGKPKVTIPAGKSAPKDLRAVTLVQGGGPAIRKGQLLVAQYVGVLWRTGKEFDSSWDRGQPVGFPIGVGRVIAGWDEKLVGVKAGSRVLLVLPPSKGYGPQGEPNAGIKGDDTLVFVVDVLAGY